MQRNCLCLFPVSPMGGYNSTSRRLLRGRYFFAARPRSSDDYVPMLLPLRTRIVRQILAIVAMIVFVLPATGAPDQMGWFRAMHLDAEAATGLHAHGHDHEVEAEELASSVGSDGKHAHGHNHADHSHDATGLIPSLSTSLATSQRTWHPQQLWVSLPHAPFLLERPPRSIVV